MYEGPSAHDVGGGVYDESCCMHRRNKSQQALLTALNVDEVLSGVSKVAFTSSRVTHIQESNINVSDLRSNHAQPTRSDAARHLGGLRRQSTL
jgi:hypothetical protein